MEVCTMDGKDANISTTFSEVEVKQEDEIDIGHTSLQPPDIYYDMLPIKNELADDWKYSESTSHRDPLQDPHTELHTTTYKEDSNLGNEHNQRKMQDSEIITVDTHLKINNVVSDTLQAHQPYYECASCGYKTASKRELVTHVSVHTAGSKACDSSARSSNFKRNFRRKMTFCGDVLSRTGGKPYECSICSLKFTNQRNLSMHTMIHDKEKPYECSLCSLKFKRNGYLKVHMRTHTGEKPYKCSLCSLTFTTKGSLDVHVRTHTGEKPYECSFCSVKFKTNGALKVHLRTHTGEKPYECSLCLRKLATNGGLSAHMRCHTGEKPYKCSLCSLTFTTKGSLDVHMRTHTGEKPYECSVCSVKFKTNGALKVHMRTHTGEKPYKCSLCPLMFTTYRTLSVHTRIHTGEKPHEFPLYSSSSKEIMLSRPKCEHKQVKCYKNVRHVY